MSGADTSFVSARFLAPDYLVQGQDNAIRCPLWQDGALVAPTQAGSTVSVYDSSGNAVVNAAAVTVSGSIATYTVPSSALPSTLARGMGWRVEWSLVVSSVNTVYRNAAGLVKSRLAPVVTDQDLYRRESALNPSGSACIHSLTDLQDFVDEAWTALLARVAGRGSVPHLIMEPAALREAHLTLALHLIYTDFTTRLSASWQEKAAHYATQAKAAWDELRFEYDADDDGTSDGRRKRAASGFVFLGGFD